MRMTSAHSGFSLLELSVVMIILGLIVSFGFAASQSALKTADSVLTRERLGTVQKALDAYAAVNGFLPCPAPLTLAPSSASYGVEARTTTTCTHAGITDVSSGTGYIGAVPVRTLGLPDAYAGDAWGNKLRYAVSGNLVGSVNAYATLDGAITIKTGDAGGTNYTITSTRPATNTVASAAGAAAAYVVLSHGPSGGGAYPVEGTSVALACGSANSDDANCDSDLTFYDNPVSEGNQASTFFDDYVVWRSNNLSRLPLGGTTYSSCSGTTAAATCEKWCAPCFNTPIYTPATVCDRIITSMSPCQAYCIYAIPAYNIYCP